MGSTSNIGYLVFGIEFFCFFVFRMGLFECGVWLEVPQGRELLWHCNTLSSIYRAGRISMDTEDVDCIHCVPECMNSMPSHRNVYKAGRTLIGSCSRIRSRQQLHNSGSSSHRTATLLCYAEVNTRSLARCLALFYFIGTLWLHMLTWVAHRRC